MGANIQAELRDKGGELVENHDEEVIDAVISDVEDLDSENSEATAAILRMMMGREEE